MAEQILSEIGDLISAHTNRHVDDWKAAGKPVVGYFCHYVPAELIVAAGALPLRFRGTGSEDSASGDAYLSGRLCTYVRHVMSLVLDGHYQFLDGVITSNTCDHVRRASDVFKKKSDVSFQGFLSVPRSPRESLYSYYLEELRTLYQGMGEAFGVEVSDESLRDGIRAINANRKILTEINQLRLPDRPKLTGAESLAIHVASQVMPPEEFIKLAAELPRALEEREGLDSGRGRLLLIGAELDEPEYIEAIESQGALVVADRLCFGARSVLDPIDPDCDDPMDAIGRAYFFRPSCARMMGDFPKRWALLEEQVSEARIDGVIFERVMFCDPWGADLHNIHHRLRKVDDGFPFLSLNREYGIVPTGQLKTRVQAFLEKLEITRAQQKSEARETIKGETA